MNEHLRSLIAELRILGREKNIRLWERVADDLERPSRNRRSVNIYVIDQYTRDGETALVPGKVLSVGELSKKLTVAAFQFSNEAKEKINEIGKAITIQQLVKDNPAGKNVRIIG